jgi:hypothetical protein
MILWVLTIRAILRRWNFDCRLFDHWSLIGHLYLKILSDDPECFDNASNLEEVEFLNQTIWSLIVDQSCVPEDLTWWSWEFWQCDQSWLQAIWSLITDQSCTWRSYLMILSVLTMRAILRRRKYWAVRLTSPAGYFPLIQLNKRIVPVRFFLADFSCIEINDYNAHKIKINVSQQVYLLSCYSQVKDRLKGL